MAALSWRPHSCRSPRRSKTLSVEVSQGSFRRSQGLELLKEIAPGVKRATMIFNPDTAPGRRSHYLPSFEAAARSLRVEPITEPVHNEAEIETVVTRLGHKPESGLVVIGDSFLVSHRKPIILAAAQNKVPARRLAMVSSVQRKVSNGIAGSIPAEILAYARTAYPQRRSSNANSLQSQNSAGFPQICAIFQRDNLRRHF